MQQLNEGITYGTLAPADRDAFRANPQPEPVLLPAGYKLYKWTEHHALIGPHGRITPWWSSFDGLSEPYRVPRFIETVHRAQAMGASGQSAARARLAVAKQWNGMSAILQAVLLQSVWALVGVASHQRAHNDPRRPEHMDNVLLIGGDFQLFIPSLTPAHIRKV